MPSAVLASIIFSSVYLVTCIIRWYAIVKIVIFLGKDKPNKPAINVVKERDR